MSPLDTARDKSGKVQTKQMFPVCTSKQTQGVYDPNTGHIDAMGRRATATPLRHLVAL